MLEGCLNGNISLIWIQWYIWLYGHYTSRSFYHQMLKGPDWYFQFVDFSAEMLEMGCSLLNGLLMILSYECYCQTEGLISQEDVGLSSPVGKKQDNVGLVVIFYFIFIWAVRCNRKISWFSEIKRVEKELLLIKIENNFIALINRFLDGRFSVVLSCKDLLYLMLN